MSDRFTNSGAAPAAAQATLRACERLADIRSAVHDDGSLERMIVEAGVEADQSQRVAILANVRILRLEQSNARTMRFRIVGETSRDVVAAALPVRNELLEEERMRFEIEHPQSPFSRRLRIIDD